MSAILAATIRVVDQPLARPLGGYCPKEGLHDQLLRHAGIEGIADQFAVEQVLDASKVKPALVGGDVGDVRQPPLVRTVSRRVV